MKTGAKLALALVAVALAAAGGGWYWYRSQSAGDEARYRTAKVERGPLAATVTASGTLNAVAVAQVGAAISGEIKEIRADFKSVVKKGQVLALIDPAAFEQRVAQARADVAAAEGAAARQRRALLRQAELDLERTLIRAPVDGTVILRNVDAGQAVSAGAQAPVLFAIAQDLRDMQLEAAIDAADADRVRVGLPASFSVEALPRRSFSGEVRQVRKAPGDGRQPARYTMLISAANPDLVLLPGMTASVRVTFDVRPSALKVPNAALRFRPPAAAPSGAGRVWVLQADGPAPVDVRLGLTDGAATEIVDGALAEGDRVIVGVAAARL